MIYRKWKSAVTCFFYGLPLAFDEYTFPERIESLFHNDSDNQLLDGRDEVDEPEEAFT